MSEQRIRVAILDDHQSIVDGYHFRLAKHSQIEVVAAVNDGEALEALLASTPVDLAILDLHVPASPHNPQPYPILHAIPDLRRRYPRLALLVISMMAEAALARAVVAAGAKGYILKGDLAAIRELGAIVLSIAGGGTFFSQSVRDFLPDEGASAGEPRLTPRQMEAISLCVAYPGRPLSELAAVMGISESTLANLVSGAYARLGVRNRAEAISKAQALGLVGNSIPTDFPGRDTNNRQVPGRQLTRAEILAWFCRVDQLAIRM